MTNPLPDYTPKDPGEWPDSSPHPTMPQVFGPLCRPPRSVSSVLANWARGDSAPAAIESLPTLVRVHVPRRDVYASCKGCSEAGRHVTEVRIGTHGENLHLTRRNPDVYDAFHSDECYDAWLRSEAPDRPPGTVNADGMAR